MKSYSFSFGRMVHVAVLAMGVISLGFAGCSMKQDPFADKSDDIRTAQPPKEKPMPTPIVITTADVLQIDTDDFYTFQEGTKGEFKITGRVLIQIDGKTPVLNKDYELNVDNISEFPGATFNKTTGMFSWTPPTDFVDQNYTRQVTMEVSIRTMRDSYARSEIVKVFVERLMTDPSIVSVDDLTAQPLREGDIRAFRAVVFDPDAENTAKAMPQLMITNAQAGANIGSRVKVVSGPTRDTVNKSNWIFDLQIDLRDIEITKSEDTLQFGLMSVSRFGRSSAPKSVPVKIKTLVSEPIISWPSGSSITFVAGQPNVATFTIMDPKSEGKVRLTFTQCPVGKTPAVCRCQAVGQTQSTCTIEWRPDKADAAYNPVSGTVYNDSPIWGEQPTSRTFQRDIRVIVPAAPVCPAPSPKPTPRQP